MGDKKNQFTFGHVKFENPAGYIDGEVADNCILSSVQFWARVKDFENSGMQVIAKNYGLGWVRFLGRAYPVRVTALGNTKEDAPKENGKR